MAESFQLIYFRSLKTIYSAYFCEGTLIIMWQRIPPFLRNKYILTLLALLVWLTFFDRNNFIAQVRLGRTLNEHRQQREFYKSEIKKDSTAMKELMSDSLNLEKFAREKYLMKKDNEDIYLIVKEKEAEKK
jgi:cell division protein DivIC